MERPVKPFRASLKVKEIAQRFGAGEQDLRVRMRDCDDVPRFIQKVERAHQQTAKSKLRFGPAPSKHLGNA